MELVSKVASNAEETDPQGLKPALFAPLSGTTKVMPFPKPTFETICSDCG
jgi:hypothetical protein